MRVRWIGDARLVPNLGCPTAGEEYDVPEDVGASLCEQGKAVQVLVIERSRIVHTATETRDEGARFSSKVPPKPAVPTDEEEEE